MKPYVIAVAGGSASGKTTMVNELIKDFGHVVVLHQDDYYKDQSHLSMSERKQTNYDHPNAFDEDLLVSHIRLLKENHSINQPVYDFVSHNRLNQTIMIEPQKIVIVEGLFVLYDEALKAECDLLIYVDCDDDIRFMRRLKRDIQERGRSLDSVYEQYIATVKPMYDQFIKPTQYDADLVIYSHHDLSQVIDLLKTKLNSILISEN